METAEEHLLVNQLPEVRKEGQFCDVVLTGNRKRKAPEASQVKIRNQTVTKIRLLRKKDPDLIPDDQECHRLVLAAAGNDFMKRILDSTQDLEFSESDQLKIILPDFSLEEVNTFLRFIYGKEDSIDLTLPICDLLLNSKIEPNAVVKAELSDGEASKDVSLVDEADDWLDAVAGFSDGGSDSELEAIKAKIQPQKRKRIPKPKDSSKKTLRGTQRKPIKQILREREDFLGDVDSKKEVAEQLSEVAKEHKEAEISSWTCPLCDDLKDGATFQALESHIDEKHGNDCRTTCDSCERCGRLFNGKTDLLLHDLNGFCVQDLGVREKLAPFKCELCQSCRFYGFHNLQGHVFLQHRGIEVNLPPQHTCHYCEICFRMFNRIERFKSHQLNVHQLSSENFVNSDVGKMIVANLEEEIEQNRKFPQDLNQVEDPVDYMKPVVYAVFCRVCKTKFPTRYLFIKHFKKEHAKIILKPKQESDDFYGVHPDFYSECVSCQKKIPNRRAFAQHCRKVHQTDNVYNCKLCKKPFPSRSAKHRHWKTCGTGGNLMKCEYCDKTVKDKFGMVNHIRRMHPDKAVGTVKAAGYFVHERVRVDGHWKYKCDICNKLIESNSRVFHHKKIIHGIKSQQTEEKKDSWPCPVEGCDYVGKSKGNLTSHAARHKKPAIVCEECGATFVQKGELKKHKLYRHNSQELVCEKCSHVFTNVRSFNAHMQRHHSDKRYKCPHCDKTFCAPNSRAQHVIFIHSDVKEWVCRCGHAFKIKSHLKRHMLTSGGNHEPEDLEKYFRGRKNRLVQVDNVKELLKTVTDKKESEVVPDQSESSDKNGSKEIEQLNA